MLINIQNIEDECGQLEDECEQLKRRINRLLKDDETEKLQSRETHEAETSKQYDENQAKAADLKTRLFTFTETVDPDAN